MNNNTRQATFREVEKRWEVPGTLGPKRFRFRELLSCGHVLDGRQRDIRSRKTERKCFECYPKGVVK